MANYFPLVVVQSNGNGVIEELPASDNLNLANSGIVNLNVANLQVLGGTNGQYLQTDGTGNLSWATGSGGGNGSPGGSNTQLQYNNAGIFGGITGVTSDGVGVTVSNANIHITGGSNGQVLTTDGTGNLSWATGGGGGAGAVLVTSAISAVVAGEPILVQMTSNALYPGGIFTLYQSSTPLPSITMSDQWSTGGTSKPDSVTANVLVTLTATNTTFAVVSTDNITLGSSTVTGANLLSLGISGTGGTYTIPSTFFDPAIQSAPSTAVSASLTTANGVLSATGTTLTTTSSGNVFSISGVSGTFANSTVPFWSSNQALNWSINGIDGVITGGTVIAVTPGGNVTLTSNAAISSNGVANINSVQGPITLVANVTGNSTTGTPGTANANGAVTVATSYTPLFNQISPTANGNPVWDTANASQYFPNAFVLNSGTSNIVPPNSTSIQFPEVASNTGTWWLSTPGSVAREPGFYFLGGWAAGTPDFTVTQTIAGQTYTSYGFLGPITQGSAGNLYFRAI